MIPNVVRHSLGGEHLSCCIPFESPFRAKYYAKTLEKYVLIYNIFMALLSVGIVALLIIDATGNTPNSEISISDLFDKIVWIIFTIDYATRFLISENKIELMKITQ